MTDRPRFQMADGAHDECYRHHHGAVLVAWVFRVADWWLKQPDAMTNVRFSVWEKHHDAPQR